MKSWVQSNILGILWKSFICGNLSKSLALLPHTRLVLASPVTCGDRGGWRSQLLAVWSAWPGLRAERSAPASALRARAANTSPHSCLGCSTASHCGPSFLVSGCPVVVASVALSSAAGCPRKACRCLEVLISQTCQRTSVLLTLAFILSQTLICLGLTGSCNYWSYFGVYSSLSEVYCGHYLARVEATSLLHFHTDFPFCMCIPESVLQECQLDWMKANPNVSHL